MKTIYLGYHDMEMFVDRNENIHYKISFKCPHCKQADYAIKDDSKGKFIHECGDCGQIFMVDYENL